MNDKVVLLDLENNLPTAKMLRDIVEHYSSLYLFNLMGQFNYALEDLTELSAWISSGQIVILDTPRAKKKEFEYAVVVGQLMALLAPGTHIEVVSAMDDISVLMHLLDGSELSASLIQVQTENAKKSKNKQRIPDIQTIKTKPYLQQVKKYCDALAKMAGRPSTVDKLINSIANILQLVPEKAQHLLGLLINLKIVKREAEQVSYRKKVLKEWADIDVENSKNASKKVHEIDDILSKIHQESEHVLADLDTDSSIENIQNHLYKNFSNIDPVQMEVIQKLNDLKSEKPKDIYQLRDLLEKMFPKTDIRLLLKELIEKGYIYWNGHDVVYSHEMMLN